MPCRHVCEDCRKDNCDHGGNCDSCQHETGNN